MFANLFSLNLFPITAIVFISVKFDFPWMVAAIVLTKKVASLGVVANLSEK
jgi:hypothetical protein